MLNTPKELLRHANNLRANGTPVDPQLERAIAAAVASEVRYIMQQQRARLQYERAHTSQQFSYPIGARA